MMGIVLPIKHCVKRVIRRYKRAKEFGTIIDGEIVFGTVINALIVFDKNKFVVFHYGEDEDVLTGSLEENHPRP